MKQVFIFLAGSTIILLAIGLILSANIFGIFLGVFLLIGFSATDFSEKYWKICSTINNILESRK